MRITVLVTLLVGLMCRPAPAAAQVPVPSSGASQSDSQQATAPAAPQTTPAAPQNPPTAAQAAPAATDVGTTTSGSFDVGGRGTTYTGDPARYNEFRDMSNGLFLDNFGTAIQKSGWFMNVNGNNAGRKDAFYSGEAVRPGRVKIWGSFSQVPWLVSDTTKTIYQGVGTGTLTIPNYVQSLLQANASQIGAVAATATPFDLSSGRKYSTGGFQLTPDLDTTVTVDVNHMDRTGDIVGGGTFGFSAADELPIPVNQHQTDADAGIERTAGDLALPRRLHLVLVPERQPIALVGRSVPVDRHQDAAGGRPDGALPGQLHANCERLRVGQAADAHPPDRHAVVRLTN